MLKFLLETVVRTKPVWPEYWKLEKLEGVKASLSVGKWNAQWMQAPTSEEGALIKREGWKKGEKEKPALTAADKGAKAKPATKEAKPGTKKVAMPKEADKKTGTSYFAGFVN